MIKLLWTLELFKMQFINIKIRYSTNIKLSIFLRLKKMLNFNFYIYFFQ